MMFGAVPVAALASLAISHASNHAVPAASPPAAAPSPVPAAPVAIAVDGTALPPPHEVEAAPIAMLVDLNSGRTLYAKNEAEAFPPASVTKTMTAFVAFELLAEGRLKADQHFTVSDAAWKEWHAKGSRMFIPYRASVSVDDLLMGIMNVSANDGCIVLAEGVAGSVPGWVAMMNDAARRLGMSGSHFGTPNGWMDKGVTHYTARDLVKLADAMITRYPAYFRRYVGHAEFSWNGITQRNHDPILGVVPGADGIKTGFTGEAHYTYLGTAERGGRRLVMVLAGVPTPREREKAAKALMEWGFSAWDGAPLVAAGKVIARAEVQGGTAPAVDLVAPRAYAASLPHGDHAPVSMRVIYTGPLQAPIARGAQVAQLAIRVGAGPEAHLPLVAGADVPAGSAVDRLAAGFARLWPGSGKRS